jgi:hypothetical protein
MIIPSIRFIKQFVSREKLTPIFLQFGFGIPIIFFATTIICGFILGDYNHLSRLVSELGALGTSSQYVFSTGLLLSSVLSILFVIGLINVCTSNGFSTVPAIFILSFSISIAGAAIFPLPLRLHLFMGMPSVFMVLSPILSIILWVKTSHLPFVRSMSFLSLIVMSLGFLAFDPNILSEYAGLKQRLFHVGWSIWFFYLSYSFSKLWERPHQASPPRI